MGIDCSGLVSMAYLLCGISIYRDARIVEGFPIREIDRGDMKPGDLLFFPGHVAMYLGDGRDATPPGRRGMTAHRQQRTPPPRITVRTGGEDHRRGKLFFIRKSPVPVMGQGIFASRSILIDPRVIGGSVRATLIVRLTRFPAGVNDLRPIG